ncbi:hypothetical protein [Conyzicola sp.]|uniref:hypothetical protein n=1 Tax=Conyzicola sp. TaxID=1969404 RepID=UPI003988E9D9
MTRPTPLWRHVANGAGLVVILVLAGVVAHTTPNDEQQQAPIPVRGQLGETLSGRNIVATVDEVRVAKTVEAGNGWAGPTTGVWVVVDASVESRISGGTTFGYARFTVGDVSYSASTRPDTATIAAIRLSAGIPWTGPLMFELPAALLSSDAARHAELQLAVSSDPRADSMIVIPVDLHAIEVASVIETDLPVWGAR